MNRREHRRAEQIKISIQRLDGCRHAAGDRRGGGRAWALYHVDCEVDRLQSSISGIEVGMPRANFFFHCLSWPRTSALP